MGYAPSFRLDGQRGIVLGAGRGLGRAIALAVAESGADVALVARDADQLHAVAAEITDLGRVAVVLPADVSDISYAPVVVERAKEELGTIDFLVNSAGTNIQRLAVDVTESDWDMVHDINLKAAFFWSQAVAKSLLAEASPGRIVHIASQMAVVGFSKRAAYAASKHGLVGMTKVLALEWASAGIRVNCIGPTFVDTPLARKMFEDAEIAKEVMRRIPIGRLGRTDEIAAAALYLLSPSADAVTGQNLLVDGGWTAQ